MIICAVYLEFREPITSVECPNLISGKVEDIYRGAKGHTIILYSFIENGKFYKGVTYLHPDHRLKPGDNIEVCYLKMPDKNFIVWD